MKPEAEENRDLWPCFSKSLYPRLGFPLERAQPAGGGLISDFATLESLTFPASPQKTLGWGTATNHRRAYFFSSRIRKISGLRSSANFSAPFGVG